MLFLTVAVDDKIFVGAFNLFHVPARRQPLFLLLQVAVLATFRGASSLTSFFTPHINSGQPLSKSMIRPCKLFIRLVLGVDKFGLS